MYETVLAAVIFLRQALEDPCPTGTHPSLSAAMRRSCVGDFSCRHLGTSCPLLAITQ